LLEFLERIFVRFSPWLAATLGTNLKDRTYAPSKNILGDPIAALSSSGMDVVGKERC